MDPKRNNYSSSRSLASYFWQFILLFLAVSLALFLDGYWKGQKTSKKEKSYAWQIVSELNADIGNMEKNIRLRNARYDQLDSMFNIIGDKKIFGHENELYFFARLITGDVAFLPGNHSLKRLNSSEGYSLQGSAASVDTILSYGIVLDQLNNSQKKEAEKLKLLLPYIARIFNPYELEKMEGSDGNINSPVSSPFLKNADPELLNEFAYYLQDYKSEIRKTIRILRELQVRGKRVVSFLGNQYP